jgi:hypothetical protein
MDKQPVCGPSLALGIPSLAHPALRVAGAFLNPYSSGKKM